MPSFYLSTTIAGDKSIADIADLARKYSLDGVELSSSFPLSSDEVLALRKRVPPAVKMLVHNYFPRPEEDFVLNLASLSPEILRKSRELCSSAVLLCSKIGTPFYSVHAGFAFDAAPSDLGRDLTHLTKWPLAEAKTVFIESLRELCAYARERNIRILVENNVLAPFNLVNGRNELLLGVTAQDLSEILGSVAADNLGLLVDVGHLKVSSFTLGFSAEGFLESLGPYIEAIHLSDNDGSKDTNSEFTGNAWFLSPLKRLGVSTMVIEVRPDAVDALPGMVAALKGTFGEKGKA